MPLDPYGKVRPRKPSLKHGVMVDVTRGAQRVRAWPSKRGPAKTLEEAERREKWRKIQILTKYWPGFLQAQYAQAVKGTALLPRDLMTMVMYGRFCGIKWPDGRSIYPMTARQDISESLDILAQVPGSMLFRGADWWEAVPLGLPGQVLTINPAGDGISWEDSGQSLAIAAAGSFHWDGATVVIDGQAGGYTIARTNAGIYRVTLTSPLSDAEYIVLAGGKWPTSGNDLGCSVCVWRDEAMTTTTFVLEAFYNNSSLFDPEHVYFIIIDLNA